MSMPEYNFFHGAALSLVVGRGEFTGLTRISDLGSAAYAINHNIGIYIKHATNGRSPWRFTFSSEHQDEIRKLFGRYQDRTYVVLVCGKTGVCALTYGQYAAVIDENFKEQEALVVEKPGRGGFRIRGAKGRLRSVVSLSSFPRMIFA